MTEVSKTSADERRKINPRDLCLSGMAVLLLGLAAYSLAFSETWLDWDMQRYVVEVKISPGSDGSFSPEHNLLKMWLLAFARVIQHWTGALDTLSAARVLTALLAFLSSILVYAAARRLTDSRTFGFMGGVLWFLFPANTMLISALEDNVWANAFNVLFVFQAMTLCGFGLHSVSRTGTVLMSFITGICLSVGINIHQQLVVLMYVMPVAVFIALNLKIIDKVVVCALFFLGYVAGSVIQNAMVLHSVYWAGIMERLYHQAYAHRYPNLWYFSSGLSPFEWIRGEILEGWSATFLFSRRYPPPILVVLLVLAAWGIVQVVHQSKGRGGFFHLRDIRLLLFLGAVTLIHVPHSLVYEPRNPERWDSTIPGIILLLVWGTHQACRRLPPFPRKGPMRIVRTLVMVSLLGSIFQAAHVVADDRRVYRQNLAKRVLQEGLEFLTLTRADASTYVVMDPAVLENDLVVQLTYHFPDANVLVLNKNLKLLYTSFYLQHRPEYAGLPLDRLPFPSNAVIGVMAEPLKWIDGARPGFRQEHSVVPMGGAPPVQKERDVLNRSIIP